MQMQIKFFEAGNYVIIPSFKYFLNAAARPDFIIITFKTVNL